MPDIMLHIVVVVLTVGLPGLVCLMIVTGRIATGRIAIATASLTAGLVGVAVLRSPDHGTDAINVLLLVAACWSMMRTIPLRGHLLPRRQVRSSF